MLVDCCAVAGQGVVCEVILYLKSWFSGQTLGSATNNLQVEAKWRQLCCSVKCCVFFSLQDVILTVKRATGAFSLVAW